MAALLAVVAVLLVGASCAPRAEHADLQPTLSFAETPAGRVAVQAGIPVPTFERQPRPTLDLGGAWQVEDAALDVELTMTDRTRTIDAIEQEAAGRHLLAFDDSTWRTM